MEDETMKSINAFITLIVASHGTNHMLQLILPTLLPTMITEFQMSNYVAGIVIACFIVPYSLLQIPFGYLSDRMGRRRIMIFGLLLYSIGTLLSGLSQNVVILGLTQFLAGVGGAFYHPIGIPLLFLVADERRRGQAMGFHQTGGAVGSVAAPLLSAYIAIAFGWRYSFAALSLLGFLSLLMWLITDIPASASHEKKKTESLKSILFNSKTIRLIVLIFIFGLMHVITYRGLTPFLTTYATRKFGISLASAAQLLSLMQIMGVFGSPLFGRLSDKTGRRAMLAILLVAQSAIMYLITLASLESLVILLGAMGLIIFGCLTVTDVWIPEINVPAIMGTVVGVALSASFFAGAIVTPTIGYLADQVGFDYAFRLLSVVVLFGLPMLKIIKYAADNKSPTAGVQN